jgi:HAD superfamily hydrolase (TIGR01509 family)
VVGTATARKMQGMIDWSEIDTVLLDMDGVLLDLRFDNWFWREHVPARYASTHGLRLDQAESDIFPKMRAVQGTLSWYCVDYWSEQLGLDIVQLKSSCVHWVSLRPRAVDFLDAARDVSAGLHLVTNAPRRTVDIKFGHTGLLGYFDEIICSHDYGAPKEDPSFWFDVFERYGFDPARALFIDDNIDILRTAREFGIGQLLAVHQPDSGRPEKDTAEFAGIRSFAEIMP